ncbi:MAG: DUF3343 domain-containing protein [Planctomycetota bacterium]|jgi:hypothetical protein
MNWFKRNNKKNNTSHSEVVNRGLLIFSNPGTVVQAEEILKEYDYDVKVVSPPEKYRTGCDLSVEFPLVEEPGITRILKKYGLDPMDVLPISSNGMEPLKLCITKDFGQYLMVRTANLKITVDKATDRVVNVSGGGCPDVPYLAHETVGKLLSETPEPLLIGYSLGAYTMSTARKEMLRIRRR